MCKFGAKLFVGVRDMTVNVYVIPMGDPGHFYTRSPSRLPEYWKMKSKSIVEPFNSHT